MTNQLWFNQTVKLFLFPFPAENGDLKNSENVTPFDKMTKCLYNVYSVIDHPQNRDGVDVLVSIIVNVHERVPKVCDATEETDRLHKWVEPKEAETFPIAAILKGITERVVNNTLRE